MNKQDFLTNQDWIAALDLAEVRPLPGQFSDMLKFTYFDVEEVLFEKEGCDG